MPEQASSASGSRGVGSRLKSHAIDQAISDIYEGFELDYSHWTKQQFLSIFAVIGLALSVLVLVQIYNFRRLRTRRGQHDHEA